MIRKLSTATFVTALALTGVACDNDDDDVGTEIEEGADEVGNEIDDAGNEIEEGVDGDRE
jgi:hypothetical protein